MEAADPGQASGDDQDDHTRYTVCTACRGTGMCNECDGNGRYFVRGLGMFDCTVCSGDGACTTCAGTGRRAAA